MGPEGAVNIVYGRELAAILEEAEATEGPLSPERRAEILAEARKHKVVGVPRAVCQPLHSR